MNYEAIENQSVWTRERDNALEALLGNAGDLPDPWTILDRPQFRYRPRNTLPALESMWAARTHRTRTRATWGKP